MAVAAKKEQHSLTCVIAGILLLGGRDRFSSRMQDYHTGFATLQDEEGGSLLGGWLAFNTNFAFPHSERLEEIIGSLICHQVIYRAAIVGNPRCFIVGDDMTRQDVMVDYLNRYPVEIVSDIARLAKRFTELVPAVGEPLVDVGMVDVD